MQRGVEELANSVSAFFKRQGAGLPITIPLMQSKEEAKLPEPVISRSNSSQKSFTPQDLICDEDFDLQNEKEFASLCNDPEKWTSCDPPSAIIFLSARLAAYKQRLEAALKLQAAEDKLLQYDANHIAIKKLLGKRIEILKKIIIDYNDCLDERSLALRPLQLYSFLQVKLKNSLNEFKPCEIFSDAIFICHSEQALVLLSLEELAKIVEKHGRSGLNGVAGIELCKIIIVEVIRRFKENQIVFHDENLRKIQNYLFQNINDLSLQLNMGLTQVLYNLLETDQLSPADPQLHALLIWFKEHQNFIADKLFQAIRDATIKLIHARSLDVFSADLRQIFTCLQNTPYYHPVAKTVTSHVIAKLQDCSIDPQVNARELETLLAIFRNTEHVCFDHLQTSINTHLNAKANAFRKIYHLLYAIINNPFKSNYLSNKDTMPAGTLLNEIRDHGYRIPLVGFVWDLLQRHYPNITEHNKVLFKELYKAKFAFSFLGLSKIAGTFFWVSSDRFKQAVDALTDTDIDALNNIEATTCRAMIYRGLKS